MLCWTHPTWFTSIFIPRKTYCQVIFVQCVSVANLPWALAGEQKASMNNCFPSRVRTVPAKKMLQHFRMKNLMPFPEEEITQQTFGLNLTGPQALLSKAIGPPTIEGHWMKFISNTIPWIYIGMPGMLHSQNNPSSCNGKLRSVLEGGTHLSTTLAGQLDLIDS